MKTILKRADGSLKVLTTNTDPSLTQQQFKKQTDINNIMKKFKNTGEITHLNRKRGVYLDSTTAQSYQDSLQTVIDAQNAFHSLPADLRKRFGNDPSELMAFMENPKNYDEAVQLGIIQKKETTINDDKKTKKTNDDKKQTTQPTQTQPTE